MGDSCLHVVVHGQRPEPCVKLCYMKLFVDRDLNCGRKLVI